MKKISFQLIFYIYIIAFSAFYRTTSAFGQDAFLRLDLRRSTDSLNQETRSCNLSPYRLDFNKDIALFSSGTAIGISGLVLMHNITPLTLEEIAQLDPKNINPFDRNGMGQYREVYDGDILLYGSYMLPFTFLSLERMRKDWKMLAIIGAEVLLIQSGLTAIVKSVILRTRPFVYDSNASLDKKTSKDARISFYSGHASTTAAMSFFVAKVFSDYYSEKTVKTFIWIGAALYPALVSYLRVDSGWHFRTDVIAGYIMGALIGYFIPEIHKVGSEDNINISYGYFEKHVGLRISYKF